MPRKAATVSEESEPKKKTTKKAASTTVKKTAAKKPPTAEEPETPAVEESAAVKESAVKEPAKKEPVTKEAVIAEPVKAKRATRKKAAVTEAAEEAAPVAKAVEKVEKVVVETPAPAPAPAPVKVVEAPAPQATEEPKKKPRGKKAAVKAATETAPEPEPLSAPAPAPEAPAQRLLPLAAATEPTDWRPSSSPKPARSATPARPAAPPRSAAPARTQAPAPVPAREPAPAPAPPAAPVQQTQPTAQQQQDYRPRPLYISREVEACLRAANIPLPTEKAHLDAIMNAMSAAKAAAQAAASAYAQPPVQQRQAEPQPQQQQPGQPGQQGGQPGQPPQQRHQRDQRDPRQQQRDPRQQQREPRNFRDNRDNRDNRGGDNRDNRDNRESSEARENRESREAAEYAEQLDPNPPKADEPVEVIEAEGYCEISGKGFGFLRDAKRYFMPSPADVFVTPELVKRFGLRDGHWLTCSARKNNRGLQVHRLHAVNGLPPEDVKSWPSYEDLTTISPLEHIKLETVPERTTTRVMDLMTPIGKGQRGLIVAPPRTGKTTLLNHIAEAVVKNHPDMKLIILLVDERPEEVTDFKRAIPQAELWASSNDMDVKSHTRIATLAIERARRLVESGSDVFVLMDSITRMGRAFNNALTGGGRTMSGGVDARALEMPRKIFAAARNTEEAGSLTIVATALIDTGSRMDELIFQEFKGTGNCEIVLDRKISDQRVYPAIDIFQSGTRREELILPADSLHKINVIRRGLSGHKPFEAIERMLSFLKRFPTNAQLLREIPG